MNTQEHQSVISFVACGRLHQEVAVRTLPGGLHEETAERDLARFYASLRLEMESVDLCEVEWNLLRAVLNGYLHVSDIPADVALVTVVHDALQFADLGKDGESLLRKIAELTPTQALAVIDAAEKWWVGVRVD
jgi:hypothetical protein